MWNQVSSFFFPYPATMDSIRPVPITMTSKAVSSSVSFMMMNEEEKE